MKLESLDFEGGDVKKNSIAPPKTINTNIAITNAKADADLLTVKFNYTTSYLPDESYIRIAGRASFRGKEAKKAYDDWSKTGRIGGEQGEMVLNAINYNASLNAIFVSRAFNLAPPLILPTLTFTEAPKEKKPKK